MPEKYHHESSLGIKGIESENKEVKFVFLFIFFLYIFLAIYFCIIKSRVEKNIYVKYTTFRREKVGKIYFAG